MTPTPVWYRQIRPSVSDVFNWLAQPGSHWIWVSVFLYVAACFLPAMPGIFEPTPIPGWVCLATLAVKFPCWWANPSYFLALFLAWGGKHRFATVFAVIAMVLAVSFELLPLWERGVIAFDEFMVGCHVWVASMQVLACNLMWREWHRWSGVVEDHLGLGNGL